MVREAERARFGELLAAHLGRTQPQVSAQALERERDKALRAPLIIVVAAHLTPAITKVPQIEQTLSAGAAAHNIMLAAFALGFNAMWKTGGAAYDAEVKRSLGLEPGDAIVGFLYIGTEAPPAALAAEVDWRALVREF